MGVRRRDLPRFLAIRRDQVRRIFRPGAIVAQHIELQIPGRRAKRNRRENRKGREQSSSGESIGSVS